MTARRNTQKQPAESVEMDSAKIEDIDATEDEAQEDALTEDEAQPVETVEMTVVSETPLNIRSTPEKAAGNVICTRDPETPVEVVGDAVDGWHTVLVDGIEAYAMAEFLE